MLNFDFKEKESVLKNIGVTIYDEKGDIRSFGNVLDDVAKAWRNMSSSKENEIMKAYVAESLVGIKDTNEFITYLNNKEVTTKIMHENLLFPIGGDISHTKEEIDAFNKLKQKQ